MSKLTTPGVREALLAALNNRPQFGGSPTQESVLQAAAERLGIAHGGDESQQALLTQWGELFRTGLLAWGRNLCNPNPPFFHCTDRGRQALALLTRDPSNPAGYLRHLNSVATIDAVALSYLSEALDCYVAGLFKAAAVMAGAAAESVMFGLRDATVQKLNSLGQSVPKAMLDWKPKSVADALHGFFEARKARFPHSLPDEFVANWSAFTQQIRATRNEAGHPASIEPVTADSVHASLLVFPEVARLASRLVDWVRADLD